MSKRSKLSLVIVIIFIVSFIGCSSKNNIDDGNKAASSTESNSAFSDVLIDSYNRQVKIEKEPQRVISIAPNITEIIFALDKESKLVGRSDYCDYPEKVKKITSVGAMKDPSLEKIAELQPDLVIASTNLKKEAVKRLELLGIKVVVLYEEESFEGVYENVEKVGKILNAEEKAQRLVSEMKVKVRMVMDKVKDANKPLVYYVISFGKAGENTAGKDTFLGNIIEMAGGRNAAFDVEGWSYSVEKLAEKNPNIIICSKYNKSKQGIKNTNGYRELKAVKAGKLYEIDNNLLDRQGIRLADGLMEMAKIIHPEVFK